MSCGNSQFDHGDSDSKHDNIDDGDDNSHIDQKYLDKQSRTIGTYGLETMAKLISFKVLIVGCGGVGIEIAKNLALAGIHTIRLYDPQIASPKDMGVNFAISTSTIDDGKTRAEASQAYIAELNPNTRIIVAPELTEDVVKVHHAVIFTAAAPDLSLRTLTRWNLFCHSQKPTISFLLAFQFGAMGSIFADHGPQFVIKDADGRPAVQKTVLAVTELVDKTGEPYTRVRFETPEGQSSSALRDYTSIKFTEVCGLTRCDGTDANNVVFDAVTCPADPRNTIRIYPSLRAQGYGPYVTGGFIHELKEVIPLSFRTLEEAIISPGTFVPVSSMMDNVEESQGHLILHALLKYADKHHGVLPSLHNLSDAEEVVQLSRAILDENKIRAQEMHRRTHDTNIHNSNNNNRGSVESSVNEKMEFNEREQEKKCCGSTTQCNSTSASGASLHTRVNDEFPFKPPSSSSSSSSCDKPTPMLIDNVNESVVRVEAMLAQAELQPLATFIGAVAAQEIVKITGKYTPIHQ